MTLSIRGPMTGGNPGQTTSSNTVTLNLPAGCVAGDIAVFGIAYNVNVTMVSTPPAGWTELWSTDISTVGREYAYAKTLDSSDIASGSVTVQLSAASRVTGAGLVVAGGNTIEVVATPAGDASGTSHALPNLTTLTANDMLIGFIGFRQGTTPISSLTWPSGWTEAAEADTNFSSASQVASSIAYKLAGAPGTYGGLSITSVDSGASVTGILAIKSGAVPLAFPTVDETGWTVTGPTAEGALSDSSDTTYLTSAVNPSSQVLDMTLPAIEPPTGDLVVTVRAALVGGGTTASIVGTLRDGTTVVATSATVHPTSTAGDLSVSFLAANISGVAASKWRAGTMVVRLAVSAS